MNNCIHIEFKGMRVTLFSFCCQLSSAFSNGPVVLVWGQIQWHKLLLDQSLSQSSREAVHVLGHPALVRHTQCWSPRLLRVSWPRPPVVWWSSVSACLNAHIGPMNLQTNSDIISFSDLGLDSFAVFYSDGIHLVNLLNFCTAEKVIWLYIMALRWIIHRVHMWCQMSHRASFHWLVHGCLVSPELPSLQIC